MNSIAAAALSAVDPTPSASIGSRSGLDLTDVPLWTRGAALSGPVLPVAPSHGFAAPLGVAVSVAFFVHPTSLAADGCTAILPTYALVLASITKPR